MNLNFFNLFFRRTAYIMVYHILVILFLNWEGSEYSICPPSGSFFFVLIFFTILNFLRFS